MKHHLAMRVVGMLLGAWLCLGWADSWDAIRSAAQDVATVQSDFIQEKHLPILSAPLVSRGAFSYRRPGSLRWEYRSPIRSVLLMHEGRVRRFTESDHGYREESSAGLDAMQIVLEQIAQWLNGRFDDNPMFTADLRPGGLIVLQPAQAGLATVLQRIELYLDERPGAMKRVVIHEGPDAFTSLSFSETIINQPLADAVFRKMP